MLRVAFLLIVLFAVLALGGFLITRLIVFWRNQLWNWKLEKEEYKKKQLREAERELIDSTRMFDENFREEKQMSADE